METPLLSTQRAAQAILRGSGQEEQQAFASHVSILAAGGVRSQEYLSKAEPAPHRAPQHLFDFQGHGHGGNVAVIRMAFIARLDHLPLHDDFGAARELSE